MSDKALILPKLSQSSLITHTPTRHIPSFSYSNSPFSFKPEKYIIPKDIPSNIIYQSMLKELSNKPPLLNTSKHPDDSLLQNRYNIIIKMKEFIIANSISTHVIFNAIYYLDYLICLNSNIDIDMLGIGTLILAVKFNELEINNPLMKNYQCVYDNVFYSLDDILYIELICLRQFNYRLNHIEPIHFLQILLLNGIVFNTDTKVFTANGTCNSTTNGKSNSICTINCINSNIYNLPFYVLEITMESIEYMEYHPLYIACACVAVSREYYSLEKWNGLLDKIFSIKFSSFESDHYDNKIANNKLRTLSNTNTDKKSRRKGSDVSTIISSSDKSSSIHSNKNTFKSKSVDKEKKTNDDVIRCSCSRIIKVNSLKNIRRDHCAFFNISEFNPHLKNKKAQTNYYSIISKAINRSSALIINDKDDKNKLFSCNSNSSINKDKEKEKEYSSEKKRNTMISSALLQKNFNLASNIYGGIMRSNHHASNYNSNISSNRNHRECRGISGMNNNKKGNRTKSMTKSTFHYSDFYKERSSAIINRNSSINSLKHKKQCV